MPDQGVVLFRGVPSVRGKRKSCQGCRVSVRVSGNQRGPGGRARTRAEIHSLTKFNFLHVKDSGFKKGQGGTCPK